MFCGGLGPCGGGTGGPGEGDPADLCEGHAMTSGVGSRRPKKRKDVRLHDMAVYMHQLIKYFIFFLNVIKYIYIYIIYIYLIIYKKLYI